MKKHLVYLILVLWMFFRSVIGIPEGTVLYSNYDNYVKNLNEANLGGLTDDLDTLYEVFVKTIKEINDHIVKFRVSLQNVMEQFMTHLQKGSSCWTSLSKDLTQYTSITTKLLDNLKKSPNTCYKEFHDDIKNSGAYLRHYALNNIEFKIAQNYLVQKRPDEESMLKMLNITNLLYEANEYIIKSNLKFKEYLISFGEKQIELYIKMIVEAKQMNDTAENLSKAYVQTFDNQLQKIVNKLKDTNELYNNAWISYKDFLDAKQKDCSTVANNLLDEYRYLKTKTILFEKNIENYSKYKIYIVNDTDRKLIDCKDHIPIVIKKGESIISSIQFPGGSEVHVKFNKGRNMYQRTYLKLSYKNDSEEIRELFTFPNKKPIYTTYFFDVDSTP